MTMNATEKTLIEASMEIGDICEWASGATAEFAELVETRGVAVGDLTVSQFREFAREYTDRVRARALHFVPPAIPITDMPAFLKKQAD